MTKAQRVQLSLILTACRFNDFFLSIGTSLAKNIDDTKVNLLDYIKGSFPFEGGDLFDFKEVNFYYLLQ